MLEVIKNPLIDRFNNLIFDSTNNIKLCAPFITSNIVNQILKQKQEKVILKVITSSNLASFSTGGSDINAIKKLIENDIEVFNFQNLHAKIYVFDERKAIITSSNLTYSGMKTNYEYGVLISEDEENLKIIINDYNDMIQSDLCGKFSLKIIENIQNYIKKIGKQPKVHIDEEGELLLLKDNVIELLEKLSPWQNELWNLINEIDRDYFTTQDTINFIPYLKNKYPKNNTIDASIRRNLQELRDIGLLKFAERGNYKKLWR